MTERFLKAKHWQLFILTTVLPFVGMIITMIVQVGMMMQMEDFDQQRQLSIPSSFIAMMVFMGLISLTAAFVQLRWQWSIAVGLQQYLHPEMRPLKLNRYKIFFFCPWIYLAILIPGIFSIVPWNGGEPNFGVFIPMMIFMFFGNFFAMFCFIYTLYFTAKTFRSAELQKEAHFSDYIGEFFLLWFHFVGVWIIQPRINAMVAAGPGSGRGDIPSWPLDQSGADGRTTAPSGDNPSGNGETNRNEQAGKDFLDRSFS